MERVILDETFSMVELVEHVTTGMTNGLLVPPSPLPQDGNNNEVSINIEPSTEPAELPVDELADAPPGSPMQVERALWMVSLPTLIMDTATLLYKPAKGVVFGRSKVAYYLVLAIIFVLGFAEAVTAFWLSRRSRDANRRRFTFGRVVLCFSVAPFVAIISIGSFHFIQA